MSDRTDFNKAAEEILSFMDSYSSVKHEHLEKFFPGGDKIVKYLLKNKRLHKSPDGIYIGIESNPRPDKPQIAALSVLCDVLAKVSTHTRATAPAQVSFITHSGEYYEIIYVAHVMEAMLAASLGTQPSAKRIVIIEDKHQMERLQTIDTTRFALVSPDGSLNYYKPRR